MIVLPSIARPPIRQQPAPSFELPTTDLQDLLQAPPIDVRLLLERCLGNSLFAVSLLEEFARTGNGRVEEIGDQAANGNLEAVAERAHALQGAAGILAASALLDVTIHTEAAARKGDIGRTQTLVEQLRHQMRRVVNQIPSVCAMTMPQQD